MEKVGLCTIAFPEKSLEEILDMAQEIGFDGVEIWGKEPHMGEVLDEERVKKARKMLEERNLSPSMFGSYLCLGVEGEFPKAESILKIAQGLGATIVRIWAGNKGSQEATGKDWENCLKDLEKVCRKAEKMGINLAMEMHAGTLADRGETARKLIEQVSLPNLKVNFQVDFPGREAPLERLAAVIPWIVNVHAQNFKKVHPGSPVRWEDSLTLIREGVIDYQQLFHRLKEANFLGYFEVEFVKGHSPEEKILSLKDDYKFLRSL